MIQSLHKYFILYFLLFAVFASSQNSNKIDSLKSELSIKKHDTLKVFDYTELARYYLKSNIDSALYYANGALYKAEKISYDYGIGKSYQYLGHINVINDDLETAKDFYVKSLNYYLKANHQSPVSAVYLVLGNVYFVQNNYPVALDYYIKGQNIADSLNQIDILHNFYNNIAGIYYLVEDYPLALKNFENALELSERIKDTETSVNILNNVSRIYIESGDYEKAIDLNNQALELTKEFPENVALIAQIYLAFGEIQMKIKNYTKASEYFKNAQKIVIEMGPGFLGPKSVDIASAYTYLGICNYELNDLSEAHKNLLKGYEIAIESGLISTQERASNYLGKYYASIGDYKNAYEYHQTYKILSDSNSNEKTSKRITHLKIQYEFDQKIKEKELEQARREAIQKRTQLWLYLIIAGVLTALIIFLLLWFLQKNKAKRVELEHENLKLDLDFKNKELTTNVLYLLKKNEFIGSISEKLKKAKLYFKPENRNFVDNIIKELEASNKKDTWEDFEKRFQEVHTGFYRRLTASYPDLSPNELKLCAFLRLNMSTKEIAAITYQSTNTLSTARYRLRKKLGLEDHANLISFLSQF